MLRGEFRSGLATQGQCCRTLMDAESTISFIYPDIEGMHVVERDAGRYMMIHLWGEVAASPCLKD